ncbi:interferon alpha-inducible protein 27-like protein 2A [Cololabis saira]|uniref:interferon alpha-inducible protein 27-like protein 2A n=1 Tax=Cololabis saira TaxID=129043 RepID=UPI002AD4E5EB|nr:interferon alpha-inducible protein 27-like protein 2A [Cololabis saira]
MDVNMEEICKAFVVGGGLLLTPATLAALAALGFTSTGILAGSAAAKMMAASAIANGGGVAAGGLVATLQSIGMAGFSWLGIGTLTGAGGSMGWMLSAICNQTATP